MPRAKGETGSLGNSGWSNKKHGQRRIELIWFRIRINWRAFLNEALNRRVPKDFELVNHDDDDN